MKLVKLNALFCRKGEKWEDVDCSDTENLIESSTVIDLDNVSEFHPVDEDGTTRVDLPGCDSVRVDMSFKEFYSMMQKLGYTIDESFYK